MADVNVAQAEEELALSSIYESEFRVIYYDNKKRVWEVQISNEEKECCSLTLQIHLPSSYPKLQPPVYEILSECFTSEEVANLSESLDDLWKQNEGESIVYCWTEKCREIIKSKCHAAQQHEVKYEKTAKKENELGSFCVNVEEDKVVANTVKASLQDYIDITSGEAVVDRKSTFQAHVARISKESQVKLVLQQIKENRKIARASHNIMAYRIEGLQSGTFLQDNDDDGENEAGSRLMHLLQILDARNIIVIVSRWYGGILLGPDRFKHINNCARELIVNLGFSLAHQRTDTDSTAKKKHSKTKTRKK